MTHGGIVPLQEAGVEPVGFDLPADPNAPTWVNLPSVPQVYADLFYPQNVDRRVNPYGDPDRVADLVAAAMSDIAVRGDTSNRYAEAPIPVSTDLDVIQNTINALNNSPLALPVAADKLSAAHTYWNRFMSGVLQAYREEHTVGRSNLVKFEIATSKMFLQSGFDPLYGATTVNVTVNGDVESPLASGISNSNVTFRNSILSTAAIGNGANSSKFEMLGQLFLSNRSFVDAENLIIDLNHSKTNGIRVGTLRGKSKVIRSDDAVGTFYVSSGSPDVQISGNIIRTEQ